MNTNAQIVRSTLAPLDGLEFADREALDNAVFPLYGPLTAMFGGESFRDMVDRLIDARWVTQDRTTGKYIVKFPSAPVAPVTPEPPKQAPTSEVEPDVKKVELDAIAEILKGNYNEAIRLLGQLRIRQLEELMKEHNSLKQ